jgi:hypothetical protein
MKRRVCSYDMFAVPDPSFVLLDQNHRFQSHPLTVALLIMWPTSVLIIWHTQTWI